ncbi:cation efflux system protein CusB [Corallococcus macrosporus]|uniref:Cation efflux system protein CusB n=1 Tax=Myxococcus fulvus (strain ATCC BAA-855 / HW-1) TaxID=483219 RepID=F8CJG5_MYXFH|nr:efflux RND transporter periplasmic adaptor subunit [Corallococcus macrosporus]AEI62678.1 cation efflux system protein CusB [Corallococcus macrosporus]
MSPPNRRRIAPWLGVLGLAVLVAVAWRPLVSWFSGPASHTGTAPATHDAHGGAGAPLPDAALEYTRAAFEAYEGARSLLARDAVEGLPARAGELKAALQQATEATTGDGTPLTAWLQQGADAATHLASAKDAEAARQHFARVSEALIALAAADPRLQEGWHVFECPMVDGVNQWLQREPKLENPYMGRRMLACGTTSEWRAATPAGAHGEGDIAHYTCPMHPSVKQHGPGACPLCGMDLTPVSRAELESGVIRVDDLRRQRIGVKTAPVTEAPMDLSLRALGRVTFDEKSLVDVTLKLDGYIHELRVNATGEPVKKGDVLFTLYSPELYAAQQEYLLARQSQSAANASLVGAARKRLALWGLSSAQIERVASTAFFVSRARISWSLRRMARLLRCGTRLTFIVAAAAPCWRHACDSASNTTWSSGRTSPAMTPKPAPQPVENMPFLAPASGYVLEKNVVEGAAVKAGERLFRIAPLAKVWVEADVYEQDLARVKRGQPVENMPFLAPASGYVLEKNVVEGAAVKAGERLFRIAPLAKVWVEADVYEQDLARVKPGQPVEVTLPYLPGKKYAGRVGYVYPSLQGTTRTGRIRIELPNPELELKPDMYADVRFVLQGGARLQVPDSAVIYTGPRRLVFVDLGEGRLRPQEVKLGLKGNGTYEVLEGLSPGDVVVTSGNFLIAAESRLRSATDDFGGGHAAH